MAVLLLLQVPPDTPSVSVLEPPTQIADVPEIEPADGSALTVTVAVALLVPQVLVTE